MYEVFYGVKVMNAYYNILYFFQISRKMPSMNTDHNYQNLVVKTEATNLSHLFNSLLKRDKKENPWLIRQSIHIM